MKRSFITVASLLWLTLGCDRQLTPNALIGSWKCERPRTELTYTFRTNNTFIIRLPQKLGGIHTGTWAIDGSFLTMTVTGATYLDFHGIPSSDILTETNETVGPAITKVRITHLTGSSMAWSGGFLNASTLLRRDSQSRNDVAY